VILRDLRNRVPVFRDDPWNDEPLLSRGWHSAAVFAAVLVAALGGWLLGGAFGGKPAQRLPAPEGAITAGAIEGGGLELVMPVGWSTDPRPARIAGSGMRKPITLLNDAEAVRVVAERLRATSTTLLPAGLVRRTRKSPGRPLEVRFADGLRGYRYAFVRRARDSSLVVDVAPTSAGIATVACLGKQIEAVMRACGQVVPTVSVPDGRPLTLGVDAAFRARLPEAIQALSRVRMVARQALATASGPAAQARAAGGLRRAYETRATRLEPLVPTKGGTAARTLAELRAAAAAYGRLARAVNAGDSGAYAKASRAVTASEGRLDDLLAG
jgi:hypothetical protein